MALAGLLGFGAGPIVPASAASAAAGKVTWRVQKSPDPSGNGGFGAVDCRGVTACVAVGSYYNHSTRAQVPFASSWNGKTWAAQAVPAPAGTSYGDLNGVSCTSRSFCSAVGVDVLTSNRWVTLAEVWRSRRWQMVSTPALSASQFNSLAAVSCLSATDCIAVGDVNQQALAERWNGTRWRLQRAPRPTGSSYSYLTGVSCVSAHWCMAAGYYGRQAGATAAFTAIWTGRRWSIQRAQQVAGAYSSFGRVSCTSTVSCVAVGAFGNFSALRTRPLAERWNGKAWRIQPTPQPKGRSFSQLLGVACSAATACTATGWYGTATGLVATFAERWNGMSWVLQATVNPSMTNNILRDVACTSATACTAVGGYAGPGSVALSLVERYGNADRPAPFATQGVKRADAARTPVSRELAKVTGLAVGPPGNGNLAAVSCATGMVCEATGSYFNHLGVSVAFAEGWRSGKPSLQSTPAPGGPARQSQLQAVSCMSATSCQAVGSYVAKSGRQMTLAEAWNGTRWTVRATANPAGGQGADLSGLWCASATSCVAVGSYQTSAGNSLALAEAWNGKKWKLMRTPTPAGAVAGGFAGLFAVQCTAPAACVAVGSYRNRTQRQVTLAELWNGATWSLLPKPNPAGASAGMLFAVSCRARARCMAVGSYQARTGHYLALAESLNGRTWSLRPAATPRGAVAVEFAGVACAGATTCFAAGNVAKSTTEVTLGEIWNGTRWAIHKTPNTAGAASSALDAISCSSGRACTAVGFSVTRTGMGRTLAERWNGTRWSLLPVLDP